MIPAELGTDKYSFTGALLDFDMSTGVPITTPTDAAGTVTISPLSLVTYTLVNDEIVSTEHGMQQDPFTFTVIGQDGPPMSLFMHIAETNLNIDWLVTNSQVDGNEGNDTIHLIGERDGYTIDEPSFDDNGVRTQVITSNKSGSTVTINDVENAVFHGVSKVTEILVSSGIDLSEFNVIETGEGDDVVLVA